MPYLHLPEQHSDADLMLAGQVAEAFESGHLYVTWSHLEGAGTAPTVPALVRDSPPHPLVEAFGMIGRGIAHVFRALRRRPSGDERARSRRERQAA